MQWCRSLARGPRSCAVTVLCRFRREGDRVHGRGVRSRGIGYSPGLVGSVIKKRRKKMRKHKHKKMLKKTRWQRRG